MPILDVVFPELADIFGRPSSAVGSLRLLARYPTRAALVASELDELRQVLRSEARITNKPRLAERLHERAQASAGISSGIDDLLTAECYLVGQLLRLHDERDELEDRIADTLGLAPEAEIVCSFPFAGQVRAATFLGAAGAPTSASHSGRALRRHLGWAVEEERSATSVQRERLARAGNRYARRELRMWAQCLVSPRLAWSRFAPTTNGSSHHPTPRRRVSRARPPRVQARHRPLALHDRPPALRQARLSRDLHLALPTAQPDNRPRGTTRHHTLQPVRPPAISPRHTSRYRKRHPDGSHRHRRRESARTLGWNGGPTTRCAPR